MKKIILSVLTIIVFFTFSCQRGREKKEGFFETSFQLGAPLSIYVYEGGEKALLSDIFDYTKTIETTMSSSSKDYDRSEIIAINIQSSKQEADHTTSYSISSETAEVLEKSIFIANLTEGGFDPTIEPMVSLWGWESGDLSVPSRESIMHTLPKIDWKKMRIKREKDGAFLELSGGQGIDVGGIAKGFAADKAREMLLEGGVKSALIDFGGNIVVVGSKQDNSLWKIGIQAPFEDIGTIVAIVSFKEGSVVTSGVYERFFEEEGKKYSHLINPHSGYPVKNGLLSVSILAKESIVADGLSTGVFVLGKEKGMQLLERLEGVEGLFVTEDKLIYGSSGLEEHIEIVDDNYTLGFIDK